MREPEVRFANAGGVKIAWSEFGQGPNVLLVPPFASHQAFPWKHPFFRTPYEYMARRLRVVTFDKRGTGMSERVGYAPTVAQRTEDILAVMDAAGMKRAMLLGVSEGGLSCQMFVTMHPERVERMTIINSAPGARRFVAVHTTPAASTAPLDAKIGQFNALHSSWGVDPSYMVDWFTPEHSGDRSWLEWKLDFQRASASYDDFALQFMSVQPLDPDDALGEIQVPTLVMHARNDLVMPFAGGRYIADQIPGAKFVELSHGDHYALTHPDWREAVDRFIDFFTAHEMYLHVARAR